MKLNPDCIRAILLTIEENTDNKKGLCYSNKEEFPLLAVYTENEVRYHINQCELSKLIIITTKFLGGKMLISDLSPKGHEFLANVQNDNNWNKTKEIANQIGSYSLDALKQIATGVITKLISSKF